MNSRILFFIGLIGAVLVTAAGLRFFPDQRSAFWLNLTSEAVGVLVGGLIVVAVLDAYQTFVRRRQWYRVEQELYQRIYWEVEHLQFGVRPTAMWSVGQTLGEDLRGLTALRSPAPIAADYFIQLADQIGGPLESINANVTPRILALGEDEKLIQQLFDLEQAGLKIRITSQYLTDASPAALEYAVLVDTVLAKAAELVDYIDRENFKGDSQQAAQARFNRMQAARFGAQFSSDSRQMKMADGQTYRMGM
jgi:hypothetical protein